MNKTRFAFTIYAQNVVRKRTNVIRVRLFDYVLTQLI